MRLSNFPKATIARKWQREDATQAVGSRADAWKSLGYAAVPTLKAVIGKLPGESGKAA